MLAIKIESEDLKEIKDPFWEKITEMAQKQRNKGLQEYGKGIEEDTADELTRLTRIQEELIDALYYIEHLKELYEKKDDLHKKTLQAFGLTDKIINVFKPDVTDEEIVKMFDDAPKNVQEAITSVAEKAKTQVFEEFMNPPIENDKYEDHVDALTYIIEASRKKGPLHKFLSDTVYCKHGSTHNYFEFSSHSFEAIDTVKLYFINTLLVQGEVNFRKLINDNHIIVNDDSIRRLLHDKPNWNIVWFDTVNDIDAFEYDCVYDENIKEKHILKIPYPS